MSDLNIKLGTLLKEERERQEIKIEDLSERLKITVPNLQSIEAGTTDGLPSDLYFSLFAKSYAEALGIDYTRTVDAIKADVDESADKKEKTKNNGKKQNNQETEDSEDESNLLKKGGIALAVIVGLFIIFIGVNKLFLNSDSAESTSDETATEDVQTNSAEQKELDEAYASYDWDNKEYPKAEKIILTLTPRAESWSAIFADGDTAIYRTLRVGRTYTAEADYRLIVSVGVPSAVTIKLNGQEVDLRNKETRRVTKVLINQMNINKFLNPDDDQTPTETSQRDEPTKTIVAKDDTTTNNENKTN